MGEVIVTQGDREAAAYYVAVNFGPRYTQSVMNGSAWPGLSNAFARHRHEATRALSAQVEELREQITALAQIAAEQGRAELADLLNGIAKHKGDGA